MALVKNDVLAIGRGNLTSNANATVIFSANNNVADWSAVVTYDQYNVVEYSGKIYRSKIASNLNNTPSSSPSQWETLYNSPKDGDVAFIINGNQSCVLQRLNSLWVNITGQPILINLVDGQLTPADALIFLGSEKPYGEVEYTLKRGTGHGRKRKGVYDILNDTSVSFNYSHEFIDIGPATNVTFSWVMSGGFMRLQYTSVLEGVAIQLKYILRGWQ